jgi:Lrp/AsnC family leucine-responsive transcriptional regulator
MLFQRVHASSESMPGPAVRVDTVAAAAIRFGRRRREDLEVRVSKKQDLSDDTDLGILRVLQANARATYTEVGRAVGLSAPSVHDRVQRLEQRGVIRGYHAELDPDVLGLSVLALVSVLPSDNANTTAMAQAFAEIEHVETAYAVAGEESHVLVVRTASMAELSEVLQRLRDVDGVARTRTAVVLSTPFRRGPLV